MYVITFYSFKGGVGRTMALVNVAADLVRRGRKVLVVDFDLEAPGLETYKHLRPAKPHPGIVEYVTEFRRSYEVPNLLDYIYEAKAIGKKGGRLWVMPAGRRDRAYRSALTSLDWQRLYKNEDGFLLFEDTKQGWEEELKPDYVLIDSRTGDTDVLGICTRQLPDSVVLMFTPNKQNLVGLENVCSDIRREETEGLKKKIRLHFVAANVPDLDDENAVLRRQLQMFQNRLQLYNWSITPLSGLIRRYEHLSLLNQSIFVLEHPRSRLARTYRRLVRSLIIDNPADRSGALLFLQTHAMWSTSTYESNVRSAVYHKLRVEEDYEGPGEPPDRDGEDRFNEIANHFLDDIEILKEIAQCRILMGDFAKAIRVLDCVLQLQPNDPGSLFSRASCKTNMGRLQEAAEDLFACLRLPERRIVPKSPFGSIRSKSKGASLDQLLPLLPLPSEHPKLFKSKLKGTGLPRFSNTGLVIRCLRKLNDIAPDRLLEAIDLPATQKFLEVDPSAPVQIASLLSMRQEGFRRAAQLLRELIARLDAKTKASPLYTAWILCPTLLQARCWRETIDLLESQGLPNLGIARLFYLALAYWGEKGNMPEHLCKAAMERQDQPEISGLRIKSWLQWGMGNVADAIKDLNTEEESARGNFGEAFSVWRMRHVSVEQYLDDCRLVRRMFEGEPLRPAFLGPAS